MKLNSRQIEAFLTKPDPKIRAVLVFGQDHGLVEERVKILVRTVVGNINDPFRVSLLTGEQIRKDPARLVDEASALSLVGGSRVVVVEVDGGDPSEAIKRYLEKVEGGSLIIIRAGDLKPASPLRKLIEKNKYTALMPTYLENNSSLHDIVVSTLLKAKISADKGSIQYLVDNLGSDRNITRSELEKLITYLGEKKQLKLEDALSVVGDSAAFSIEQIVFAAADGNASELDRKLGQAFKEGQAPVRILRATISHYKKLYLAAAHIESGKPAKQALASIKPKIMFFLEKQFIAQLGKWDREKLQKALLLLHTAEQECKTTGFPDTAICGRALITLAHAGRK